MRRWLFYAIFFVAGVAIAAAVVRRDGGEARDDRAGVPAPIASTESITAGRENAIVRAVQRASDGVVSIGVKRRRRLSELRRPTVWDQFLSSMLPTAPEPSWDVASGVIVDGSGLILTNEHVMRDAEDFWVALSDGRYFEDDEVRLLGADVLYDLAVLKIDGDFEGMAATLGDSESLMVGEWVIAIGNPFGFYLADFRPSVTVGVVSALGREIVGETGESALVSDRTPTGIYKNMIQTDAAINPGNSGGALTNAAGEVVGINTFILSTSGGNMGLGFALPVHIATRVMTDIVEFGRARHAWTGLARGADVTPRLRRELNIPTQSGVIVAEIYEDSPASRAGVQLYDVIVRVNGRRVRTTDDVNRAIFGHQIGDPITLDIERGPRKLQVTFEVKERPDRLPESERAVPERDVP